VRIVNCVINRKTSREEEMTKVFERKGSILEPHVLKWIQRDWEGSNSCGKHFYQLRDGDLQKIIKDGWKLQRWMS